MWRKDKEMEMRREMEAKVFPFLYAFLGLQQSEHASLCSLCTLTRDGRKHKRKEGTRKKRNAQHLNGWE